MTRTPPSPSRSTPPAAASARQPHRLPRPPCSPHRRDRRCDAAARTGCSPASAAASAASTTSTRCCCASSSSSRPSSPAAPWPSATSSPGCSSRRAHLGARRRGARGHRPASYAAGGTGTYVDPATGQVYGATVMHGRRPATHRAALLPRADRRLGRRHRGRPARGARRLGRLGAGGRGGRLDAGRARRRAARRRVPRSRPLADRPGARRAARRAGHRGRAQPRGRDPGVGDRRWTPTASPTAYDLGAGSATLGPRSGSPQARRRSRPASAWAS